MINLDNYKYDNKIETKDSVEFWTKIGMWLLILPDNTALSLPTNLAKFGKRYYHPFAYAIIEVVELDPNEKIARGEIICREN